MTQKLGAEALGTFIIVFAGAGTAAVTGFSPVATALAFGFAVLVMMYAVGYISGGHFNPAVSVGHAISGRISWRQAGMYAAAQLAAALLAGLMLFAVLHGFEGFDSEGNMGQNSFGDESPREFAVLAALLVEILATFVFVMMFLAMTDQRHPNHAVAPVVVGLSLVMLHLVTVQMTGTSLNPARSIGVGLFAGGDAILQLWLFILAPLLGAVGAGAAYPAVFGRDAEPVPGSGLKLSLPERAPRDDQQQWVAPATEQQQWTEGEEIQTEYPGWRWDAEAQQWVPDPTTAPHEQAPHAAVEEHAIWEPAAEEPAVEHPPYDDPADDETREFRRPDGS